MFDFKRAERPAGWVTEREACSDWFNSTFKEVDVDAIESPEYDRHLRCRDLPEEGLTISQYGEYSQEDRFSYTIGIVDTMREIVVAQDEDGDWYFGIDGCGYDFYDAHWIKLYRAYGICWHSTEDEWLKELQHRISSYVEMCADVPKGITWSDRNDLMKDAVDAVLDPTRIEKMASRIHRRLRLRRFVNKIGSILAGNLPRRKHLGFEHRVSVCD